MKISMNLPDEIAELMTGYAGVSGLATLDSTIRRYIKIGLVCDRVVKDGGEILIRQGDTTQVMDVSEATR